MKFLMVSSEDIAESGINPEIIEKNAHYIDRIMCIYYVHAGNKYSSWISLQIPGVRYCEIEITVI